MNIKISRLNIIIFSIISAALTWYLNHQMGYGSIVANGLVGVIGAILLPGTLAGAVFTSSFVGMSGLNIIPSLPWAIVGGVIVGIVITFSTEVYAGLGGKGGTTAATSTLITRMIINILG